eukprot:4360577-Alexandrium_andersonii.AAC.1
MSVLGAHKGEGCAVPGSRPNRRTPPLPNRKLQIRSHGARIARSGSPERAVQPSRRQPTQRSAQRA